MTSLKPGDKISCRIHDNSIVSPDKETDEIKVFEIVAAGEYGYYVFVPQYLYIKDSKLIDERWIRKLGINPRFLGEQMSHVMDNLVHQIVQVLDGMFCCVCHEFISMGAPNQPDKTLICWNCRQNPYH